MNVKELKERLERMDDDLIVYVDSSEGSATQEVKYDIEDVYLWEEDFLEKGEQPKKYVIIEPKVNRFKVLR
jgi:hypothetical protein